MTWTPPPDGWKYCIAPGCSAWLEAANEHSKCPDCREKDEGCKCEEKCGDHCRSGGKRLHEDEWSGCSFQIAEARPTYRIVVDRDRFGFLRWRYERSED